VPLDEFAHNGLMAAMAAIVGQPGAPIDVWRQTLTLFAEMMAGTLRTDACSLTTALSALEKSRLWERSLEFLAMGQMGGFHFQLSQVGSGSKRSNFATNSALSSQSKSSAWREALELFGATLRSGAFRPDVISLHVRSDLLRDDMCEVCMGYGLVWVSLESIFNVFIIVYLFLVLTLLPIQSLGYPIFDPCPLP
jgi:hypothetical protein